MAVKDTIAALTKRGISEEVAKFLANKLHSLAGISAAGVDGLVEIGVEADVAESVISKIGTRKPKSRPHKEKEVPAEAEKTAPEPAPPLEEYTADREPTPTEEDLLGICKDCGIELPLKVVRDIADRIKDADLSEDIRRKLIVRAGEMYDAHKMVQNESAGVMAAHSIGEPGTQMNLRTFHVAGDASVAVTRGLPRLIEIVDARREPSTPSMTIPLIGLAREDKAIAEHVASEIEITMLSNVATIETDITHMKILIKFDSMKLDKLGLTVDNVVDKLGKIKVVRGLVSKAGPDDGDCDIVISADAESEKPFTKLLEIFEAIKKAQLKGVDGIKRALVTNNNGIYTIVTEGSNMREVLQVDGVDVDNVMTNSILEIADVFGIEAARNSIISEATSTLKDAGLDVDIRHIMLVADLMTNDGAVRAIGRNGVSGKKSSVLARAAFEITAAHLLHAAMVGEVDKLEGVTENIIVGQPVTLGTGAIKLYYNPDKIKNKENIE